MNSTLNASNNALKLVQDSVQQPANDIFEDISLQMSSGEQQAPPEEPLSTDIPEDIAPPEEEMISGGLSAPLHPGAQKYYKERGWM